MDSWSVEYGEIDFGFERKGSATMVVGQEVDFLHIDCWLRAECQVLQSELSRLCKDLGDFKVREILIF